MSNPRVLLDLDTRFPTLSSWAKKKRKSLNERVEDVTQFSGHYFGLRECCWQVRHGRPRFAAVGPINFLTTLDEFFRCFASDDGLVARKWRQVAAGGGSSSFLDTVVEATWALHLEGKGTPFLMDQPLGGRGPKDADLVLGTAEPRLWLDVKSVDFDDDGPLMKATRKAGVPRPKPEVVKSALLGRAKRYYNKKFKRAVEGGDLGQQPVGLLLCLLKSEPLAHRAHANLGHGPMEELPLPIPLADCAPNLAFVLAHQMTTRADCDILQPAAIVAWVEPRAKHFLGQIVP